MPRDSKFRCQHLGMELTKCRHVGNRRNLLLSVVPEVLMPSLVNTFEITGISTHLFSNAGEWHAGCFIDIPIAGKGQREAKYFYRAY